jgi:hypothetical protein
MLRFLIVSFFIIFGGFVYAEDDTINTNTNINSSGSMDTTIQSPPPSAISPQVSTSGSDLCVVGISGAVQTQILGISGGKTVKDLNCERLRASKLLYDLGMKVASVALLCQDERVRIAMSNSGSYCPINGKIGDEARLEWEMKAVEARISEDQKNLVERLFDEQAETKVGLGVIIGTLFMLLLL